MCRRNSPPKWWRVPDANKELEWGAGWYYDTTVGRLDSDWQDVDLPQPTKDTQTLVSDFECWGYCLIEEGVSSDQCALLRARIEDQAEAERMLGIAHVSAAQQAPVLVNTIYILEDVDDSNGGTLIIPGSHKPSGQDDEQFELCHGRST